MPNLMKTLTIESNVYEVCDAAARETLESEVKPDIDQLKTDLSELQTALIGVDALADAITEVVGA